MFEQIKDYHSARALQAWNAKLDLAEWYHDKMFGIYQRFSCRLLTIEE